MAPLCELAFACCQGGPMSKRTERHPDTKHTSLENHPETATTWWLSRRAAHLVPYFLMNTVESTLKQIINCLRHDSNITVQVACMCMYCNVSRALHNASNQTWRTSSLPSTNRIPVQTRSLDFYVTLPPSGLKTCKQLWDVFNLLVNAHWDCVHYFPDITWKKGTLNPSSPVSCHFNLFYLHARS